jgi:hypothetical protein
MGEPEMKARRCPACSKLAGQSVITDRHADGKCAVCSRRRAAEAHALRSALSIHGKAGRPRETAG